ncbi:hypothetical protein [Paraburkholderia flagellata]|uniref:hypothetical protein n=1 Tax=Paraburkholderia flagellata TaxID=2883241 RepID=UPI001F18A7C0|nr:hypothetical protein [Paraburkholderia flagellata]
MKLAHWNLPTDIAGVRKLLCDAVVSGRLVPVINREYRGLPRVAQPDPAPQRWPATGGGGGTAYPKVISYDAFQALQRANGELAPVDAPAGGVGTTLDPLPDLGATAKADDGFGLSGFVKSAAGAWLGGGGDDSDNDDTEGGDASMFGDDLFSADSGGTSTALSDAQPFDYQPDISNGDSFDIAKTPNDGEPGTWYTNPGSGQMRLFGDDGKPVVDLDFDHFHNGLKPHAHNWTGSARDGGDDVVPFSPWSP